DSGHQLRGKCQVRVGGWVRCAEFNAFSSRVIAGQWDADGSGAVGLGVSEVHWGLETRVQTTVGIDRWVGQSQDRRCMFEKTADVVAGDIGKPGVTGLIVEERLAVFP